MSGSGGTVYAKHFVQSPTWNHVFFFYLLSILLYSFRVENWQQSKANECEETGGGK